MPAGYGDVKRLVDVALKHFNLRYNKGDAELCLLAMVKEMRDEVSTSNVSVRETFHRLVMEVESRVVQTN